MAVPPIAITLALKRPARPVTHEAARAAARRSLLLHEHRLEPAPARRRRRQGDGRAN
jgi:hypothetical protein